MPRFVRYPNKLNYRQWIFILSCSCFFSKQ